MRKGFTLIEIIFVIIVLGIVSSIGAETIAKISETFIVQNAKQKSTEKAELALEQITNRLLYRMELSLRAKKLNGVSLPLLSINAFTPNREDYVGLEWIGYDNDGFSASSSVWTGFADLDLANYSGFISTGSDFTNVNNIMENTTGGRRNAAIIFLDTPAYRNGGIESIYKTDCLYRADGCIFSVLLGGSGVRFAGSGDRVAGEMVYSEFYTLSTSAYTIMPEPNGDTFDLYLYYNYQPWLGEVYTNGTKVLLASNISVFRFKEENKSIRLKICIDEEIKGNKVTSCREKAVIR